MNADLRLKQCFGGDVFSMDILKAPKGVYFAQIYGLI